MLGGLAAFIGLLILAGIVALTQRYGVGRISRDGRIDATTPRAAAIAPAVIASAGERDMPDSSLTPGAVAEVDAAVICRPGYATTVRPTGTLWKHLKEEAYDRYGLPRGRRSMVDEHGIRHPAFEVDHLIPLELGGDPTDIRNLWPEPTGSARVKNVVEDELHAMVCGGRLSLTQAQATIARNWKTAVPGRSIP